MFSCSFRSVGHYLGNHKSNIAHVLEVILPDVTQCKDTQASHNQLGVAHSPQSPLAVRDSMRRAATAAATEAPFPLMLSMLALFLCLEQTEAATRPTANQTVSESASSHLRSDSRFENSRMKFYLIPRKKTKRKIEVVEEKEEKNIRNIGLRSDKKIKMRRKP